MTDDGHARQTPRRDVDAIVRQAARYEPYLAKRQAQAVVAYFEGYTVSEMADLFDGEWGDTNKSTTPKIVGEALSPGLKKYEAAKRMVDDLGEIP